MGNLSPDDYAAALHFYVTSLKPLDPGARLVGPNILNFDYTCFGCSSFTRGQDWVDQFRAAYRSRYGAEPPLDVWSLHTYDLDWRPGRQPMVNWEIQVRQIQALRAYLDAVPTLRERPIWLTEFASVWAFAGYEQTGGSIAPLGPYQTGRMVTFLRQMLAWFHANAAANRLDRWFVYASNPYQDRWSTAPNGLHLLDGPRATSPLTPMGTLYRNWSLGNQT